MTRFRSLILASALVLVSSGETVGRRAAESADGPIRIPTEAVPLGAAVKGEALPRATMEPRDLALSPDLPSGVTLAPGLQGTARYGTVTSGDRRVGVGILRSAGVPVRILLDVDRDGQLDVVSEQSSGAETPSERKDERTILTTVSVGNAVWAVTTVETLPGYGGLLLVHRPKPGAKGPPMAPIRELPQAPPGASPPAGIEVSAWATTPLGGGTLSIAIGKPVGDERTFLLDANADGDFDDPDERVTLRSEPLPHGAGAEGGVTSRPWEAKDVECGGWRLSVRLQERFDHVRATVNAAQGRRGVLRRGTVDYGVFLLDGDLDGRYASPDDLWWFGPVASFAARHRRDFATMFEATEPASVGGETWRLLGVAAAGVAEIAPAGAVDADAYLARRTERLNRTRWFPRFEREAAEGWGKSRGVPTPAAAPSIPWRYGFDRAAAIARAAAEKKPLLVFFDAGESEASRRLDYWTFADPTVAQRLARFTLWRIDADLDERGLLASMRGPDGKARVDVPMLVVLDGRGQPVPFRVRVGEGAKAKEESLDRIAGWQAPAALVTLLDAALSAAARMPAATAGGVAPEAFLAGWAEPVGTDRCPKTGYPLRIRRTRDGGVMVLVPAGTFRMGRDLRPGETATNEDRWKAEGKHTAQELNEMFPDSERPAHDVTLSRPYYLDVTEVTNAQFQAFTAATGYRTTAEKEGWGGAVTWGPYPPSAKAPDVPRGHWGQVGVDGVTWKQPRPGQPAGPGWSALPVVLVSWHDAAAYARWTGASLPTEAQFERALLAGRSATAYTWGDTPSPLPRTVNLFDVSAEARWPHEKWEYQIVMDSEWALVEGGYVDGFPETAPVGSFPANALGVHDLDGNVGEWCADWIVHHPLGPVTDPVGPASGKYRVQRGASWLSSEIESSAPSDRYATLPDTRSDDLGFRLAATAGKPPSK